jgi:hypothetical protein
MSEALLEIPFFTDVAVELAVAEEVIIEDPEEVVLDTGVVNELGGTGNVITTTANTSEDPVELIITGLNNEVTIGTGAAVIAAVGGGAIVEAVQLLAADGTPVEDVGKQVKLGDDAVAYNGGTVDLTADVAGDSATGPKETVAEAAGGLAENIAFYAHGGTGNDTMVGSSFTDFIRGGGGDDAINAAGGNDLVRGGYGSDAVTLGLGSDTLYYTLDQIVTGDIDSLTDFVSGTDAIWFDTGISATISGDGQSILIKDVSTGAETTLISQGNAFLLSDINFLA